MAADQWVRRLSSAGRPCNSEERRVFEVRLTAASSSCQSSGPYECCRVCGDAFDQHSIPDDQLCSRCRSFQWDIGRPSCSSSASSTREGALPRPSCIVRCKSLPSGSRSQLLENPQEGRAADEIVVVESLYARKWRRRAQRRAVRQGAASRNQYAAHLVDGAAALSYNDEPEANEIFPLAHLHIYDLHGAQEANSTFQYLGLGLYHVGVEILGVEWSFGYLERDPLMPPVSGVYPVEPKHCPIGVYRESVVLGPLRAHGARDVWRLLERLAGEWLGEDYHPLQRNCLHFCSTLCGHLGLDDLPAWTGRLANAADTLLSPLLSVFDISPMNMFPQGDDNENDAEDGDQSDAEASPSLLPMFRRPQSKLSVATQVALDFEDKFAWALMTMLMKESAHVRLQVESCERRRESMSEFL